MSVVWMDDPSYYPQSLWTTRYTLGGAQGSSFLINATAGRFGGPAWVVGGTPGVTAYWRTPGFTALVTGTVAFSINFTTFPSVAQGLVSICTVWDGTTVQCDVRVNNAGQLQVTRAGTSIGPLSTNTLSTSVWYRIEFQVTIATGTGGNIEVRVNGTSVNWIPSTGGLLTKNASATNTSFNEASLGTQSATNWAGNAAWNDFVVTDSNSPNAGFLGDKRCYLLQPNADSSVQWTNNWAAWAASTVMALGQQIKDSNNNVQMVTAITSDDKTGTLAPTWSTTGGNTTTDNHVTWTCRGSGANPGAHNWMAVSESFADGDNSYNSSSTPTQQDTFTVPNLPAGATNVAAVDNVLECRKDDVGVRTIEGIIISSGHTQTGPNLNLSSSYAFLDQIQETDPNGGGAWTVSGVNNATYGYNEVA